MNSSYLDYIKFLVKINFLNDIEKFLTKKNDLLIYESLFLVNRNKKKKTKEYKKSVNEIDIRIIETPIKKWRFKV
jgi:hypothetical protein